MNNAKTPLVSIDLEQTIPVPQKRGQRRRKGEKFDVEALLAKSGLEVEGPIDRKNGRRWKFKRCPFDPSHADGNAYVNQYQNGALSAGCRNESCEGKDWHALRPILEGLASPTDSSEGKQSTILLKLAMDDELFHTPEKEAYAIIKVKDHSETWAVSSRQYKESLCHRFYLSEGRAPGVTALTEALNQISARANFEGEEFSVFVRIARVGDVIYIDLGDDEWTVVEITAEDCRIIRNPPVRFRRPAGMRALPVPTRDGKIDDLREFLNVDEDGWILILGWLVQALCGRGPYLILILQGEQGSAKSTAARFIRSLVDPARAPLRSLVRSERDLWISADNCHVLAYDNLSGTPHWISDAFSRVSTGGGFGTRSLYTNSDEFITDATRPILLNGIDQIATRQDLLDRSLVINMTAIPAELRRTEKELKEAFEAKRAGIFGTLLTAVSASLRNYSSVKLDQKPRMVDCAVTITAAEEALGLRPGSFMEAFSGNRAAAVEASLEGNLIVKMIYKLLEEKPDWDETATDLLKKLSDKIQDQDDERSPEWPKIPSVLTKELKRLAPVLRPAGIDITCGVRQGHDGKRIVTIRSLREGCKNIVSTVSIVSTADAGNLTGAISAGGTSADPADDPMGNGPNDRQHSSSAMDLRASLMEDRAGRFAADDHLALSNNHRQQPSSADLRPQLTTAEELTGTADDADDADDLLQNTGMENT